MGKRIIMLLDMDAFFAMIEQRENPHFKGKPIVVGADPKGGKGRGVVSTANYEARTYGIHSAQPISKAFFLCKDAVFLPVQGELYAEVSSRIMDILHKHASHIEQVSLDEAYLDVSFTGSFQEAEKLAETIRKEIWDREKLTASCGIGPNKMIAKIACEKAKPNGVLAVETMDAESFLAPLPIREIPGVGPKTEKVLQGFFKKEKLSLKDVRKAAKEELVSLLGAVGGSLYGKVRGKDEAKVVIDSEAKSIGKEHTFEKDTRDGEIILSVFRELAKGVITELRAESLSVKTITVVCRFEGFETHTKAESFKNPMQDWPLFEKEAVKLLLRFLVENPKPVRLVGVRARVA